MFTSFAGRQYALLNRDAQTSAVPLLMTCCKERLWEIREKKEARFIFIFAKRELYSRDLYGKVTTILLI